jgi:hypothetical protein
LVQYVRIGFEVKEHIPTRRRGREEDHKLASRAWATNGREQSRANKQVW